MRTAPSSDTYELILAASITMFADRGFAGVSIRDIAARVGITPGAIYHHFSGKRELFRSAVDLAFDRVTQHLLDEAALDAPPTERLRHVIASFARYNYARPDELRLVDRVIFDGEPLELSGIMNELRDAIAGIVSEISSDIAAGDVAEHVIGAIYGAAKLRRVRAAFSGGDRFHDADALAESLTRFTLRSLDKRSA